MLIRDLGTRDVDIFRNACETERSYCLARRCWGQWNGPYHKRPFVPKQK